MDGEMSADEFGDGSSRGRAVGAVSDQMQSICRRLQFPQTGRCSLHLTRRNLHFKQPFLDLRWPTLAGRPVPALPADPMAKSRSVREYVQKLARYIL